MAAAEKGRPPSPTAERQIQDDAVLVLLRNETKGRFAPRDELGLQQLRLRRLGLVVARVSGKPFGDFLRQRIFAPLEIDHTLAYE